MSCSSPILPSELPDEHRRAPRIESPSLCAKLPALGVAAPVHDISTGGFALRLDCLLPGDAEHLVEFRPSGVLGIMLRATLAHCRGVRRPDGHFETLAGFSFVEQEDSKEALELLFACLRDERGAPSYRAAP